jgi:hypothetical protein
MSRFFIALIIAITLGSFLLNFWWLAAAGVVLAGFVGRGIFAPGLGLLLDLGYGAPLGLASYFFFPFLALGLATIVLRYAVKRYVLRRASADRL